MSRWIDNIENISTGNLKQRSHELRDELALVSKKNIKLQAAILADRIKVMQELDRRVKWQTKYQQHQ